MTIDLEELEKILELHTGVFDDVATEQLSGWGGSSLLIHKTDKHFKMESQSLKKIAAGWRSGSGSNSDRRYATHALRTWHLLAKAYIELREYVEREEYDQGRREF